MKGREEPRRGREPSSSAFLQPTLGVGKQYPRHCQTQRRSGIGLRYGAEFKYKGLTPRPCEIQINLRKCEDKDDFVEGCHDANRRYARSEFKPQPV